MSNLERLLILHEGLKLKPYCDDCGKPWPCRCAKPGKRTIGVGRNLDDHPLDAQEIAYLGRADLSGGISETEALWLLDREVAKVGREIERRLPWTEELDEVRRSVLIDMAYNMGMGVPGGSKGLQGFPKTLGHVRVGEYLQAADEMMRSSWARQVGNRAKRLAGMMKRGEWPPDLPA